MLQAVCQEELSSLLPLQNSHLLALFPEVPTDKLASMALLRSLNLRANPVGPEVRLLVRPLVPFELLLSPEEPIPKA